MKTMFGASQQELNDYILRTSIRLIENRKRFHGEEGTKRFEARLKAIKALKLEIDEFFT